jgi:hypothetical protein
MILWPKYRSWLCVNTRTRIYISAKKKSIDYRWKYWTFTINCFLEHEWYLCPSLLLCTTFICDDYTTCLKTDELHHPCNDNTRTMQKQCFFFFEQISSLHSFFVCAHAVHAMLHTHKCKLHSSLKNKIINLTSIGKDGTVTELHNLWGCSVFRGVLITGVRFNKISYHKQASAVQSINSAPWNFFPQVKVTCTSWRIWTDDERLWQVLASFPADRQKIPKWLRLWEN